MNMSKFVKVAKRAAEYFTVTSCAVTLFFTAASFLAIPLGVASLIAAIVGLAAAVFGGRGAMRDLEALETRRAQRRNAVEDLHEVRREVDEIRSKLVLQERSTVVPLREQHRTLVRSQSAVFFKRRAPEELKEAANSPTFPVSHTNRAAMR